MGTVLAIGSALGNVYGQNKNLEAQARAQQATIKNLITSMNYSFQNLEQERRDAFEATIAELENIKIQGNRQITAVSASVNEGLAGGGRTADLIKRSSQADVNRTVSQSKTNYQLKSNEIDLNKEAIALNTKEQIAGMPKIEKPSLLSTLFSLGSAYFQWQTTKDSINGIRNQAGIPDKGKDRIMLTFNDVNTSFYGEPQKAYDNILGGAKFLNDPAVNFKFSFTNPIEWNVRKEP